MSIQDFLIEVWEQVGEYLHEINPDCINDDLWDFYDLYPAYVERMMTGSCSLRESLSFEWIDVLAELHTVMGILACQG